MALKKIFLPLILLCSAIPALAQSPTYTIPQTVQQSLATNVACTGGVQDFPVQNLGQTQHYAFISYSPIPLNALAVIKGIDVNGNAVVISDALQGVVSTLASSSVLVGLGYFPKVEIEVTCSGNSAPAFSITYMGTSATSFALQGTSLATQVDKVLLEAQPDSATFGSSVATPPFGNSFGTLYFKYSGTGPTGSTLKFICYGSSTATNIGTGHLGIFTFPLGTTAAVQAFNVPAEPCPFYDVQYNSGGTTGVSYTLEMTFSSLTKGGASSNCYITSATTTTCKVGSGILDRITVGTPVAAATIKLFDVQGASCTGTPASGAAGVITLSASPSPLTLEYNMNFANGICIVTSGATDLNAVYQ